MAGRLLLKNRRDLEELEEGDLIQFERGLYSHWAVYVGNERVIHLTGVGPGRLPSQSEHVFTICGKEFDKARVKEDNFFDVVGDSRAYRNNSHDGDTQPRRKMEIVQQAIRLIGEVGYNIITKNCEHFATFCRYGKAMSDQVRNFLTYSAVGVTIGGLLIYMFKGKDQ